MELACTLDLCIILTFLFYELGVELEKGDQGSDSTKHRQSSRESEHESSSQQQQQKDDLQSEGNPAEDAENYGTDGADADGSAAAEAHDVDGDSEGAVAQEEDSTGNDSNSNPSDQPGEEL